MKPRLRALSLSLIDLKQGLIDNPENTTNSTKLALSKSSIASLKKSLNLPNWLRTLPDNACLYAKSVLPYFSSNRRHTSLGRVIKHYSVSRFAILQMLQSLIDLLHFEHLNLGFNIMAQRKLQHLRNCSGTPNRRCRHRLLPKQ
jgi:hypothetical protein